MACSAVVSTVAWAGEMSAAANAMAMTKRGRMMSPGIGVLLIDDDLRVVGAKPAQPGQRRIGRFDVIVGAAAHPIKPLTAPVDWRNEKIAGRGQPRLQPVGIGIGRKSAGLH